MWTRALLKDNAKTVLRRSYWRVFLACLIVSLLCGSISLNYNFGAENAAPGLPEGAARFAGNTGFPFSVLLQLLLPVIIGVGVMALLLVLAAVLCWGILVTPVLQVGHARYLTANRSGDPGLSTLFSGFGGGRYWNTVGVMFWMNLRVFLWTLLLIVPGIVKSYQYRFIPFLLAENPDMTADRAFEISTMMTDGEKWNIFVLDLSFVGWNLLGLLLFGIGTLFVDPYVKATEAELYAALRAKVLASGYVTEEELTGQS